MITHLKTMLFSAFIVSAMLFSLTSCKSETKPKDPEEVAEDMNKPNDDASRERDERFLMKAAEINLEEIQLGQLAQQKGTMTEVKEMGKMMQDAHVKSLAELTSLASSKSIAIPTTSTKDVQDAYQKMSEKTGNDFDKDYCDRMVMAHKDAINTFESAVKECKDPDIVAWATASLPTLRTHLDHANMCQEKAKKM